MSLGESVMSERLQKWDEFKKEAFERPYPNLRKVKGWIECGEIPGRIIGNDVFIYVHKFYQEENLCVNEQAVRLLGG